MKRSLRQRSDDGNAFLPESAARTGTNEELAELLAEAHQTAVTTGESLDDEANDVLEPEEIGGPFVETDSAQEFGATRHDPVDEQYEANSLPQAVGSLAVASPEEEAEAADVEAEESGERAALDAEAEAASQLNPDPIRRTTAKP